MPTSRLLRVAATVLVLAIITSVLHADTRPNILWISCEDISAHLGCYGDLHAITPNLDRLASEGTRYSNAFTTAGVCAPCRSGIITGLYQTSLGTQHMRCQAKLPDQIKPFPMYLREAGYYCTNRSKQDYQFPTPSGTWDESSGRAHWKNRPATEQPFFAVFNFTGCHESGIASESKYTSVTKDLTPDQRQDPNALSTFPPYYPDTPVAREDWKRNYELITAMDAWAGKLIEELKDAGLYEKTIILYWSDHGIGLPRAKRWLYDSGTHIPLIVRVPARYRVEQQAAPGTTSDQLVSSIDLGPTALNLASVAIPEHVQGQPFLGTDLPEPRPYVYGARDRMDERYDIIRMVRDKRFKYLRNYEPLKTYYQYMNTPEKGATMRELRRLHEAGQLNAAAEKYFAPTKPTEELYDTAADPHELNNLVNDPAYANTLQRLRGAHLKWVTDTKDLGLIPEPILIEREKDLGSQYAILRQADGDEISDRIAKISVIATSGNEADIPGLVAGLSDTDSAVRYWAATGLGNIGLAAKSALDQIRPLLQDDSSVVRTAAARALCRMDDPTDALPVLIHQLENGAQWERLHAAIVLDESDEQARPILDAMRPYLQPRNDLYANGKYVIRVLNRAINQLDRTDRTVP